MCAPDPGRCSPCRTSCRRCNETVAGRTPEHRDSSRRVAYEIPCGRCRTPAVPPPWQVRRRRPRVTPRAEKRGGENTTRSVDAGGTGTDFEGGTGASRPRVSGPSVTLNVTACMFGPDRRGAGSSDIHRVALRLCVRSRVSRGWDRWPGCATLRYGRAVRSASSTRSSPASSEKRTSSARL